MRSTGDLVGSSFAPQPSCYQATPILSLDRIPNMCRSASIVGFWREHIRPKHCKEKEVTHGLEYEVQSSDCQTWILTLLSFLQCCGCCKFGQINIWAPYSIQYPLTFFLTPASLVTRAMEAYGAWKSRSNNSSASDIDHLLSVFLFFLLLLFFFFFFFQLPAPTLSDRFSKYETFFHEKYYETIYLSR